MTHGDVTPSSAALAREGHFLSPPNASDPLFPLMCLLEADFLGRQPFLGSKLCLPRLKEEEQKFRARDRIGNNVIP